MTGHALLMVHDRSVKRGKRGAPTFGAWIDGAMCLTEARWLAAFLGPDVEIALCFETSSWCWKGRGLRAPAPAPKLRRPRSGPSKAQRSRAARAGR